VPRINRDAAYLKFHSETPMRRIVLSFPVLLASFGITAAFAADRQDAAATVRDFYRAYLAYDHAKSPRAPRPAIALSKAFRAEVVRTEAVCKKYGEGPCGWGADGDEYLDAQETDPALTYSNSEIAISEISPGTVQVKLNVYPSIADAGDYYRRTITYKMVRENGAYVVDDISYTDGISERKNLSEERNRLQANPRVGATFAKPAPSDFVTQILEPTGGKILRPKSWFYAEGHRGSAYMWTLSREDISGNRPYTTGVRIQTFVGVKNGTGKTAKEFILDFVAAKKKDAKIVNSCVEQDQGLFTRICLETEEGAHHILYSLFWGSRDMDIAVVSIAGTTKELWGTFAPTFQKMSEFELIDMKRFPPD